MADQDAEDSGAEEPGAVPPGIPAPVLAPSDLDSCAASESFLQSDFWGRFKARFGWTPRAFSLDWGGTRSFLLTLGRRLGPWSFVYCPWGPELPESLFAGEGEKNAQLEKIAVLLSRELPRSTVFIRFDVPWYAGDGAEDGASDRDDTAPSRAFPAPFVRAGSDVQPPDSVIIDLRPPEAAILAGMKPKWRYNVGLASKKGVTVEQVEDTDIEKGLDIFYALYTRTARRDSIAIHSLNYYKTLFEEGGKDRNTALRLYFARHEGEVIASVIILARGDTGTYLYGASADRKRNLMAPYALQWRAMKDAKAAGCRRYDLFGIAPSADPGHPMAGLYRFKTGFGGSIIHRPGSRDYPRRPLLYRLFRCAETLRKGLRDAKKKFRTRRP
ncbi:MAG: peptidoglycan bridge formation glycyltransferase FemA/FemB family protein [Spirochaetaceae bacterium]|jgi:lipid II:glycine glycyltransferase (peptidoglycan interpeptide bridge formation enzyme)|nr:peptidoglycan bridge formation glycyltransferase FemA/FemB family protein [Spirochaetaceae bacterium]